MNTITEPKQEDDFFAEVDEAKLQHLIKRAEEVKRNIKKKEYTMKDVDALFSR